ncbi:hypothetical protein TNIN_45321 [Trichonephila inaurata madagascariensis]|uniref:Uncharacterized protein n=1 Tax=Trichonephila inaurata madagascariensis TaxID=2747483 RepID=A0A8X6WWK2_9ARAC|nr:hypothetical protein TNIN_45321 [Trichonephila inaurata madagascariensis]
MKGKVLLFLILIYVSRKNSLILEKVALQLKKFCMTINVSLFSSRTYSKCTKLLHKAYGTATYTLLREVRSEVRMAYEAPTDVTVVDISVSFDGVAG